QKRRQKIPSGFPVSQVFIDNLYAKKPGTISGDQINKLFRDKNIDIQNLQRAPYLSPINEIKVESMADVKSNLVDIFNSPMLEDIFLQWTNEYILQQPDLELINNKVQGIIANRKKIGIQEAHTQILSEIKSLKKEMTSLGLPHSERFFNMWGAWIIDPHVTVLGIHKSNLNRREISDYEITERTNSIPAMVENLRQQFLRNPMEETEFALVVQGIDQKDGKIKVFQIPENLDNIILFLENKGIDATVAEYYFVPSYNLNSDPEFFGGKGMFIETQEWRDSGNPSPNYDLIINFQNELTSLLNGIGLIVDNQLKLQEIICGLNDKGNVKQTLKGLKSSLKSGTQFSISEKLLDKWVSRIIRKIHSSDISQVQKDEHIALIKDFFNRYYILFGYPPFGSTKQILYRETRVLIYTASTALYDVRILDERGNDKPLISSDAAESLQDVLHYTLGRWLTQVPDLDLKKIDELKTKILKFVKDLRTSLNPENYDLIYSEISEDYILGSFDKTERLITHGLYRDTFKLKNTGFTRFIRSAILLLDPENKIFSTLSHFSKFLFESEDYISAAAGNKYRPQPSHLIESISKSFNWQIENFGDKFSYQKIDDLGVKYRNLVKKFIFSNPKEYTPYITNDKKGFSSKVFSELMSLRYEVYKDIYLSTSLHLDKSKISQLDIESEFGIPVYNNLAVLLTKSDLTLENTIDDMIEKIREFKQEIMDLYESGVISEQKHDFNYKIFDKTETSLEEYKRFLDVAKKVSKIQFSIQKTILSSHIEENCGSYGNLKEFLSKFSLIQSKIKELDFDNAFEKREVSRMSLLGKGLTSETFQFRSNDAIDLKIDFINYLHKKHLFQIWSDDIKDSGVSKVMMRLMDCVAVRIRSNTKFFYKHENLNLLIEDLINEGLAAESPMIAKIGTRYWTGHSDLIFREGDTIYIGDYKPNYDLKLNPGTHFVNAFPQLIAYALTVASQIDKNLKVKCIVFNNEESVEFDLIEMFDPIKEFLQGDFEHTTSPLLKKYQDEWETKEIFKDFLADFQIVIDTLKEKGYILNI
ncbi:MAG: hypothetical protein P8Y97_10420, partial [Candidatus Lokiarchaeota archaeon]